VSSKDLTRIRRAGNKAVSALLLAAISDGHRYKMTSKGVMVYGPHGITSTHLTGSDHRGAENFRADLRRIGITIEKGKS
jgi:hypothetical protein